MTQQNERYNSDPEYAAAFDEECEKLRTVVKAIQDDLVQRQARMPAHAANNQTANEIQRVMEYLQDSLTAALSQPYFGRVNYFVFGTGLG